MAKEKEQRPFDFVVRKADKKGRVVFNEPYRMMVVQGVKQIERPKGSGLWYDEVGNLIRNENDKKPKDKEVEKKG